MRDRQPENCSAQARPTQASRAKLRHDRASPAPLTPEHPDWDQAREKLLAYAFAALSRRALTEAELRQRLERRSDQEMLIQHVLERVRELGYQNDAAVAESEGRRRGVGSTEFARSSSSAGWTKN
ncbi:hypothetical protein [Deinococcus radiophilus]|uniref:hypothetical protein n=1 Tax=Deinococcus radiophilus TaxID=32062 RepID=UPI00360F1573